MQRLAEKPFPWTCGVCREKEVYREMIPYATEIEHDGRAYRIEIPDFQVPRCRKCGRVVFDTPATDRLAELIRAPRMREALDRRLAGEPGLQRGLEAPSDELVDFLPDLLAWALGQERTALRGWQRALTGESSPELEGRWFVAPVDV